MKSSLKEVINKSLCWWFGCQPDCQEYPCGDDDYDGESPCQRCGNDFKSFEDQLWEGSRHERFVHFFRYWFFRKWWPKKCEFCGIRFGECSDDCVPF